MQIHRLSLEEGVGNMNIDKSIDMLQQHTFDALIQEEEQKLNNSKREVVPRYRSASPPYYLNGWENEKFE